MNSSFASITTTNSHQLEDGITDYDNQRGPPPLPPKPKILPIKPSNWGQNNNNNNSSSTSNDGVFKIPQEMPRRLLNDNSSKQKSIYLDQPSSSFV